MPTYSGQKEERTIVITSINATSGKIISTNSSFDASIYNNPSDELPEIEYEHWPHWIQQVTCVSHLTIAINSSVNFFIYHIKRKALHIGILFPGIIPFNDFYMSTSSLGNI